MGASAPSGSDRDGTRADAVDLEILQRRSDSDDVGNGVECADLVKMHFRLRAGGGSTLGLGKSAKGCQHTLADRRWKICRGKEVLDRFPLPHRNILGDHLYRYPVRVLSGSGHCCRDQPDRVSDHGVDRLLHYCKIGTRVDQGAQQHVAGNPS